MRNNEVSSEISTSMRDCNKTSMLHRGTINALMPLAVGGIEGSLVAVLLAFIFVGSLCPAGLGVVQKVGHEQSALVISA